MPSHLPAVFYVFWGPLLIQIPDRLGIFLSKLATRFFFKLWMLDIIDKRQKHLLRKREEGGIQCLISEKIQVSANECIVLCYLLVWHSFHSWIMIDAKCRLKRHCALRVNSSMYRITTKSWHIIGSRFIDSLRISIWLSLKFEAINKRFEITCELFFF